MEVKPGYESRYSFDNAGTKRITRVLFKLIDPEELDQYKDLLLYLRHKSNFPEFYSARELKQNNVAFIGEKSKEFVRDQIVQARTAIDNSAQLTIERTGLEPEPVELPEFSETAPAA